PVAAKGVNDVFAWFSGHQTIALFTGEAGCFGTSGGNHHGRLFRGAVIEFGIVNLQMFAAISAEFTGKQALNDRNCLMEAFVPFQQSLPPLSNNVFVEAFPRAKRKRDAVSAEKGKGRGSLRNNGGMITHGRAGHRGHETEMVSGVGYCAEHRPGQRRMTAPR